MKQVRFAVRSLSLLSHRFEVGGLPKPDGTSLLQSLRCCRQVKADSFESWTAVSASVCWIEAAYTTSNVE